MSKLNPDLGAMGMTKFDNSLQWSNLAVFPEALRYTSVRIRDPGMKLQNTYSVFG